MLFCSPRTIDRWKKRFEAEGVEGLTGRKRGRSFRFGAGWIALVVTWVTQHTPRDFGFLRSRWACATVALLLHERHDLTVSRETVRRWLYRGSLVYRRPRPKVGPTNPASGQVRQVAEAAGRAA
jgi:transposase